MPPSFPAIESSLDAVIFDFDGVIVESIDIKTKAFCALFADEPEHVEAITTLHLANTGIDRLVKFDMIYRDILRRPLSAEARVALADRFAALVVEKVVACPLVAGANDLLEGLKPLLPCCIVSGTPELELREIVKRRGLASYFHEVRGSPRDKTSLIAELLTTYGWRPNRVVMIGDAMADLEGARHNGLAFIGRLSSHADNPFPPETMVVSDLTNVQNLLASLSIVCASKIRMSVG